MEVICTKVRVFRDIRTKEEEKNVKKSGTEMSLNQKLTIKVEIPSKRGLGAGEREERQGNWNWNVDPNLIRIKDSKVILRRISYIN